MGPPPLLGDHFLWTAKCENPEPSLPPSTGCSFFCGKQTLLRPIRWYRHCYPHSCKIRCRLISHRVVWREGEISFIFPFWLVCQCGTRGHNTVAWGTFFFESVNTKRKITCTHVAFDCSRCCNSKNDQSKKGVSSPLLHFQLLPAGLEGSQS